MNKMNIPSGSNNQNAPWNQTATEDFCEQCGVNESISDWDNVFCSEDCMIKCSNEITQRIENVSFEKLAELHNFLNS